MRPTTRSALLATTALIALALTAPTASAQNGVEIRTEPGAIHCVGTCNMHVDGSISFTAIVGGNPIVITACTDEYTLSLNEDGTGFIHEYENNAAAQCTRRNCDGVGEAPAEREWPITITETGGETENANYRFCLDTKANPNSTGAHCTINVPITHEGGGSPNPHHYVFTAVNAPCLGGAILINGSWESEHAYEIVHLDDL